MSLDAASEIASKLKLDKELNTLVEGGIHRGIASDSTKYPRIIFLELKNAEDNFYDNESQGSEVRYQFSVFCNSATVSKEKHIVKALNKCIKELGYVRYDSQDLPEIEEKIYHKALRYRKSFFN
ncbi:tail completion protein gp17 [Bacillus pumilus]|uniref:tail completion protein gp17 n=1 Tax=Bacillus pumilus TaxID=1408 RepID=UPI001C23EEE3|nr:hypothetical protein [Bacillus pumilus]MBU8575001.1 hypothetical protein [Bacillus pumilus]